MDSGAYAQLLHRKAEEIKGLDRGVVKFIGKAMVDVVQGENGTGKAARVAGITVAGKTGTAQNPHGEDHAVFVAFAPAENPSVVLSIIMENAGHGGAYAAPMAARILSRYFSTIADSGGDSNSQSLQ